jgi:glutamine synthetase
VLFKTAAKQLANNEGIIASFMAKWSADLPGCSGHLHQSLNDGSKNLFYDAALPHQMSRIFQQYLAGVIRYTPEFLALMAPTVNSYKRFVKGYWAPTHSTWGLDNRTCAFRVIGGSSSSTRLEVRVPGADMNPYLSIAAALAAGLMGIEQQLPLESAPVQGNAYDKQEARAFSSSLAEATEVLAQSVVANEVLGEKFVQHFCQTRRWEHQQWRKAVSDWELKRYFEII